MRFIAFASEMCVFICKYRRLGGARTPLWLTPVTGRSASFRLRFRFVSCVRAGEAKLRGRVGNHPPRWASRVLSWTWLVDAWRSFLVRRHVGFKSFCALCFPGCSFFVRRHVGFKRFVNLSMRALCAGTWVLRGLWVS